MLNSYSDTIAGVPSHRRIRPDETAIEHIMNSAGVYDKKKMGWLTKFRRYPGADPFNAMTVTQEYLFFTKPDLHLMNQSTGKVADSLKTYPFFVDAVDRFRPICEQLQLSMSSKIRFTNNRHPFMPILSNTVTSTLELPDIEAENEQETGANVYGTKITYRGNSYPSDQECSFSLEFEDTKYLEVYMLFKIYDEYCRYKNMGLIDITNRSDDQRWLNYTINKVLHDQFSIYKIVVGEDGMTIIYWAKYTGVYPTGVPRSAMSDMTNSEGQKITVNFKAQFVRDMDPYILSEFNNIALSSGFYDNRADLPLYSKTLGTIDGRWASVPYIHQLNNLSTEQKVGKYILGWKV